MAQTEDELKAALRLAQRAGPDRPYFFSLVIKGSKDGALIVDKRRITTKVIDEAKKLLGTNRVIRGLCHGEDGTLVFLTEKPQSPATAAIAKRLAYLQAGVKIKPVFTVASG